jgi:hypothetical protein
VTFAVPDPKEPAMSRFWFALSVALVVPGWTIAQPAKTPTVSILSCRVEKPPPVNVQPSSRAGTTIKLLLDVPNGFAVACDAKGCQVERAADDKGLDLTIDPDNPRAKDPDNPKAKPRVTFSDFCLAAGPNSYQIVTLQLPNWPGPGTNKIRLKGTLAVLCGILEQVVEIKDVPLHKNATLQAGPATLALSVAEAKNTAIRVKSAQAIKNVQFLDADGKAVESSGGVVHSSSSTSKGFGGKKKVEPYTGTFMVQSAVERCTVRLTYFQGVERIALPFDLEFDLGL